MINNKEQFTNSEKVNVLHSSYNVYTAENHVKSLKEYF